MSLLSCTDNDKLPVFLKFAGGLGEKQKHQDPLEGTVKASPGNLWTEVLKKSISYQSINQSPCPGETLKTIMPPPLSPPSFPIAPLCCCYSGASCESKRGFGGSKHHINPKAYCSPPISVGRVVPAAADFFPYL